MEKSLKNEVGEIYYGRNIKISEAENIMEYIIKENPFNEYDSIKIRIIQEKTRKLMLFNSEYSLFYQMQYPDPDTLNQLTKEKQMIIVNNWLDISAYISTEIFHREPVNINLCDKNWKIIKHIDGVDFFAHLIKYTNGSRFFYSNYVAKEESEKLYKWFDENYKFNDKENNTNNTSSVDIFLSKNGNIYQIRSPVEESVSQDQEYIVLFKNKAEEISKGIFNNLKVNFYLCDKYLRTYIIISN
jgi:hypothetical protein